MKTFLLTALLVLGVAGSTFAAPTFVGQFAVGDGPSWTTNPLCYSGQDAAAALFGGDADDYLISTNRETVNDMAWYDGWAEPLTQFAQDFKLQTGSGYNDPGGVGTAWSAYVHDHSGPGEVINYVFRNDAPDVATAGDTDKDDLVICDNGPPAVTPEPASLALLCTGALGLVRKRFRA